MPHTFDHVPLRQVEAVFVLNEPLDSDLDRLYAIRKAVSDQLPKARLTTPPTAYGEQSATMLLGAQAYFVAHKEGTGIELQAFADAIQSRWTKTSPEVPYARFGVLRDIASDALDASGAQAKVVRLTYRTLIPSDGTNLWDWMEERWFTDVVKGDVLTFEVVSAYRLAVAPTDFRISVQQVQEGMLVTTDAALLVQDLSPKAALQLAHDSMIDEFAQIVSPAYRGKWGYRPSL